MILVDMMVALALATIFILVIAEIIAGSERQYYSAKQLNSELDDYYSGKFASTTKLYGNERIETDLSSVFSSSSSSIWLGQTSQTHFTSFALRNTDVNQTVGAPNCSVDFGNQNMDLIQVALPTNPLLPLTDLQVRNGIAYVTSDSAVQTDPDLLVFDISSTTNVKMLGQINSGPGLNGLVIAGFYVFASAPSTAGQLHVFKVANPSTITLINKYRLPLPFATSSPTQGSSIAYQNGFVILGTNHWDGDELNIISVNNPASPFKVSGFKTDSKVGVIYTIGDKLYVGTAGMNQLAEFSLNSTAGSITNVANLSPSGWQRQEGTALNVFEDQLSFGRNTGGYDIVTDPELFTWASTSSTTLSNSTSVNLPGGVYGIIADRERLFIASRAVNQELQMWSKDLATSSSISLPIVPQKLTCDGNSLYVLAHNAPFIYRITYKKNGN